MDLQPRLARLLKSIGQREGSNTGRTRLVALLFLFDALLMILSGRLSLGSIFEAMVKQRLYLLPASWGVLLFGFGLAVGAWSRKAVVAAIVGGSCGLTFGIAGVVLTLGGDLRVILMERVWPYHVFWLGFLLALIATAVRYLTREGT